MATRRKRGFSGILWIFMVLCGVLKCSAHQGWDDYIQDWETNYVESSQMYPYGDNFLDDRNSGLDGLDLNINFDFPYFGKRIYGAYVSLGGFIELGYRRPFVPSIARTPNPTQVWPNQDYPDTDDPPFIAPYYSGWNYLGDSGAVYARTLDPTTEGIGAAEEDITLGMLDQLSREVHDLVIGSRDFVATRGFVVTWSDLSYQGWFTPNQGPRNTVQAAMVTDGQKTYVIYNFYQLEWIGGGAQDCDRDTGMPAEGFPCYPSAQVGFNVGKGRQFHELPYSNTHEVHTLAELSGTSSVVGRFIYGVDGLKPVRGGCNPDGLPESMWRLEIWPQNGGMFGGSPVHLSGPCFSETTSVRCRFGPSVEDEVQGMTFPDEPVRAVCVPPFSRETGKTTLYVEVQEEGESPITWLADYTRVPEHHMPRGIEHHNHRSWWEVEPADILGFSWDPHDLLYEFEDYDPSTMYVNVQLMGYEEVDNQNASQVIWRKIHDFEIDIQNEGHYNFDPANHQCAGCASGELPPLGVVRVCRPQPHDAFCIYAKPTPLGWFVRVEMQERLGLEWAHELCVWWHEEEKKDTSWMGDLSPCPLTRGHAQGDFSSFMVGVECNNTEKCPKHYVSCADEINLWRGGGSSHCCYNQEGHLVYATDFNDVTSSPSPPSTAHRAPKWGALPYGAIYRVPTMSHYWCDKMMWVICCNWTNHWAEDCSNRYMDVRPTVGLEQYEISKHANAFGDPHFKTFDGNEYTFNGKGEFWLLRVDDDEALPNKREHFNLQARFEQPDDQDWGSVQGTIMTSVAMEQGMFSDTTMPRFEARLNMGDPKRKIVILHNRLHLLDFPTPHQMRQEFTDTNRNHKTVVINNNPPEANTQSNFSFIFDNKIGVQIASKGGALHVHVNAPPYLFGNTEGLFGTWNDDKGDDLVPPNGNPVDPDEGLEGIHYQFGTKWEITQGTTLFTYYAKKDYYYFSDPDFVPNFKEPDLPSWNVTESDVDEACADNFYCRFDYKTTLSADLAVASRSKSEWVEEMDNATAFVQVCGQLYVDHSIREVTHYLAGGEVHFIGCEPGYTLRGNTHFTCEPYSDYYAHWQPEVNVECKSNEEIQKEQTQLAVAITVPILIILIVVGVVVSWYFLYYRKKKKELENKYSETIARENASGGENTGFETSQHNISHDSLASNIIDPHLQPMGPMQPVKPYGEVIQDLKSRQSQVNSGLSGSGALLIGDELIDTRPQNVTPTGSLGSPAMPTLPVSQSFPDYSDPIRPATAPPRGSLSQSAEHLPQGTGAGQPTLLELSQGMDTTDVGMTRSRDNINMVPDSPAAMAAIYMRGPSSSREDIHRSHENLSRSHENVRYSQENLSRSQENIYPARPRSRPVTPAHSIEDVRRLPLSIARSQEELNQLAGVDRPPSRTTTPARLSVSRSLENIHSNLSAGSLPPPPPPPTSAPPSGPPPPLPTNPPPLYPPSGATGFDNIAMADAEDIDIDDDIGDGTPNDQQGGYGGGTPGYTNTAYARGNTFV